MSKFDGVFRRYTTTTTITIIMEHQDWTTVYTRVKTHKPQNEKKKSPSKHKIPRTSHKERVLDKQIEDGKMKVKTFDANFRRQVQQYRLSQKLSQKAFAQKLGGVSEAIIRDLENGKLPYNPSLMSKLKRIMK